MKLDASQEFSRQVVAVLKARRLAQGISQESLAKVTGLSRTSITMIESEQRNPTLFVCHALAGGLQIDLAEVVKLAQQALRKNRDKG